MNGTASTSPLDSQKVTMFLHDQPQFPGYPVYGSVCELGFYKMVGSDIQALVLSGVFVFSSFAVFPLYELVNRMFSKGGYPCFHFIHC